MDKNNKLILSMDLSLNLPAFCVAEVKEGIFTVVELSHVDNKEKHKKDWSTAQKLSAIAEEIRRLINKYKGFDAVVRERGFSRYANTTQLLFRVVGVSDLITLQEAGIKEIEEIPPTTIKLIIAGYSRASKDEVEEGVRKHLSSQQKNLKFYSDDEADSVAVALTYCIKKGLLK